MTTNNEQTPSGLRDAACSAWKCFACLRTFTNTEQLSIHEQNEHPNEYYAAMVREMYGYQDGYDFEPDAERTCADE